MPLPVIPPLRATGPPAPAATSIPLACWAVEVSWSAAARGVFVIDTSQLDDTAAMIGVSAFDDAFDGPYDNITGYVDEIRVEHGRSDDLTLINEGSATVILRDRNALFSPENPLSPLYDSIDDRLHPIRIRATLASVTTVQFFGWVRRLTWQPRGRSGYATLECVDLLYWLGRAKPVIASTGPSPITVGQAIGLVLDAIGFVDPAMRDLADGDSIEDFSADGTKTGLQIIQELLDVDRGTFYIASSGVATYETRHARATASTAGTLTNEMRAVGPGVDADRVRTRVTVTRTGGTPQTAEDTDASNRWGPSDGPSIDSPYLPSDEAALALAQYIISQSKSPRSPLRSVDFDGRTAALLTQLLRRDFGDKITVSEAAGGTTGSFHLEQKKLAVKPRSGLVTGSWIVSRATANPVVIVDTTLLDSGAVVAY